MTKEGERTVVLIVQDLGQRAVLLQECSKAVLVDKDPVEHVS